MERPVPERVLRRWSESLAAIAMTGLGFTQSLYERERFEEILKVAADIRVLPAEHRRASFDAEGLVDRVDGKVGRVSQATSPPRWR